MDNLDKRCLELLEMAEKQISKGPAYIEVDYFPPSVLNVSWDWISQSYDVNGQRISLENVMDLLYFLELRGTGNGN